MEFSIIRADQPHLDMIVPLFDAYRRFYTQAEDLAGARKFLSSRLSNGDSTILLALSDGRSVGFTQLYPSFSSVSMQPLWILNDLFVDPGARRCGVGRRLLDAAVEFARDSAAIRLVLATAVDNHAAQALYVSAGWEVDSQFEHYNYALSRK